MIDVKEAAQKALDHLRALYPDYDLGDILLEEAELSDDGQFWLITLSFKTPGELGAVGKSVFGENRSFKIFKLLAETGEVRSMKIRTTIK